MTRTIRFYKPFGVLTKFTDPDNRPTLADYVDIPDVYPAGRLDKDSEGLLILTDDGQLSARLTQPKFAHPRTYAVQVEHIPDEAALQQLREGVVIKEKRTRPAQVRIYSPGFPPRDPPIRERKQIPTAWLEMTLTEGRNRQVRRMTAAVGHPTLRLIRTHVGAINLNGLEPGQWLDLTEEELLALRKSANL